MDFLLAIGWIAASLVFGYLVTRAIMDHFRTFGQAVIDIADLKDEIERQHKLIEYINQDDEPDMGFGKLEDEIPRWDQLEPEPEDDLPF